LDIFNSIWLLFWLTIFNLAFLLLSSSPVFQLGFGSGWTFFKFPQQNVQSQYVRSAWQVFVKMSFWQINDDKASQKNQSNSDNRTLISERMKKELPPQHREELLSTVQARFEKNMNRHKGLEWANVQAKLEAHTEKLSSLSEMERTGGEPDVVGYDKQTGEYLFYDFSAESPLGRRSVCYDREGLESRKEAKPNNNALDMAAAMGIELLTEGQYRELQKLGNFDTKTSSWLQTPTEVRKLGGAIFGDYRFGRVFVYHNGAQSYYSGRAFRGSLRV
jgi:hypothetical protein